MARDSEAERIAAAVTSELIRVPSLGRAARRDLARGVLRRLGLARCQGQAAPLVAAGVNGVGLFLRLWTNATPEALAGVVDWVCVPVLTSKRKPYQLQPERWKALQSAGIRTHAFDWRPDPSKWEPGLRSSIAAAADNGALSWCANIEVLTGDGGRRTFGPSESRSYLDVARRACDDAGIALGFTSYALPSSGPGREIEWPIWLPGTDYAISQPYDRAHRLQPDYASRSTAEYTARGARAVVVGRGLHRRPPSGRGRSVWRSTSELDAHLATTPAGASICLWPIGTIPEESLEVVRRWRAGRA